MMKVEEEETRVALERGVEQLKISTKRYARKQLAWIRNRWVGNDVDVHALNTTRIAEWNERVGEVARSIVRASFRRGGGGGDGGGGDGGGGELAIDSAEREHDQRVKQTSLQESLNLYKEHVRVQDEKIKHASKKRKYRENFKERKKMENAKRRVAAEKIRNKGGEQEVEL
jgi:hypothetical protein